MFTACFRAESLLLQLTGLVFESVLKTLFTHRRKLHASLK